MGLNGGCGPMEPAEVILEFQAEQAGQTDGDRD